MRKDHFSQAFSRSIEVKRSCIDQGFSSLFTIANKISDSLAAGGKLLLCGNGGSAADAQHLAAELLVRLRPHINRHPIPAISLALDTSTLTACANDYSHDEIFERSLVALGHRGDCLLTISTSGNSENIFRALTAAKSKNIHAFAFLGKGGGKCISVADEYFLIPSGDTAAIQEAHITAGHASMEAVEDALLGLIDD